jgi:uncharacterized protein YkwD
MNRTAVIVVGALLALLASPPLAVAGPGLDSFERAVIRQVNDARAQYGLGKLRTSRPLSKAADVHTGDMLRRDFFDHPSSDGTPFDRRVRKYAKVGLVGETLAAVPGRAAAATRVVRMWLESPPHRAIVLHGGFTQIGIGKRLGSLGADRSAVVTADFGAA